MTDADDAAPGLRLSRAQRLLYVVLLVAVKCIAYLPLWFSYLVADLTAVPFALVWWRSDRQGRRSKGYWRNVAIAYRAGAPLGAVRPRWHLWHWARHMTRIGVELARLHRLHRGNFERHIDVTEMRAAIAALPAGSPVIFATAHVGNWDAAGYGTSLLGVPLLSIYRPSPVPAVDALIFHLRAGSGQVLAPRQGATWGLKHALGAGRSVALLVDGGGRRNADFAPFLGTMASTVTSPAVLHLATGAPIVVATAERIGRLRFALRVWDTIQSAGTGDRRADVQRITARINAGLTRAVAAAPAQWFWQSRRFRHRPDGEEPGPDGLPPLAAHVT